MVLKLQPLRYIIIMIYLRVCSCKGLEDIEHRTEGLQMARGALPFWDPSNFFNFFDFFQDQGEESSEEDGDTTEKNLRKIALLDEMIDSSDNLLSVSNSSKFREGELELEDGKGEEQEDEEGEGEKQDGDEKEDEEGENRSAIKFLTKQKNNTQLKPPPSHIILVPGLGGSRLQARWSKVSVPRYFCDKNSDWIDIWVNVRLLLPYVIDCFLDNMRLEYDYSTNKTREPAGVEVRVKRPSKVSHLENLVDMGPVAKTYYAKIVRLLLSKSGFNYKRDISILGAPYDFRKAPNELNSFFDNLKSTSEDNHDKNNFKPVTYICHSMGCSLMLYFLQRQPQEWKDKYVKRLISLGAPWGGAVLALKSASVGYSLGLPLVSEAKLVNIERSLPSTMFLFPHKQVFKNRALIVSYVNQNKTTGNKAQLLEPEDKVKLFHNGRKAFQFRSKTIKPIQKRLNASKNRTPQAYNLDNMKQLFDDIKYPDGYRIWLETKNLLGSLEAPHVEVWCFAGRGFKTLARIDYIGNFPNSPHVDIYDEGDGTVNLESANYCKNWADQQSQPVHYVELTASHIEILENEKVLSLISKIINGEQTS